MSGRNPIWRSIVWVERFLPTPTTTLPEAEQSSAARRGALVPLIVLPVVVVPMLLRERSQFGPMVRHHSALFQDLLLVLAVICVMTAAIAGVVTWRREKRRSGTIER